MTIRELKNLIENKPDEALVYVGFLRQGSVEATDVEDHHEKSNSLDPIPVLIWGDDRGT